MGRKKEKKKSKIGKLILIFIVIMIIGLGVFVGYSIQKNGGGMQGILATVLGQDTEKLEDLDTINILVMRC